jgi:anti-sigma factor RsiW
MTHETPAGSGDAGRCDRALLLLSLRADGAATPQQTAELDAHLPSCSACRRAASADAAVRMRLLERADAPAPSWLAGFASRTAHLAKSQAREARSQNRLLWMSAAAAVLAAVTVHTAMPRDPSPPARSDDTASVRESTRIAFIRSVLAERDREGK